jgi:hypothetical protein
MVGRGARCAVLGLIILAVAGAAGCGDDGLISKGSYCSQLSGPVCDREIACGLGPASDRGGCLAAVMQGCCQDDNTCGQRAPSAAAQAELQQVIVDCSAALPTYDCAQLGQGNSPLACGGTAPSPPQSSAPAPVSVPLPLESARSAGRLSGFRAGATINQ